jgi:branched-subunit amino acid aminotransferase/4-amino-4-deoxychorismate lyase
VSVRHVWVDGHLLPVDGAHVSAFDRGFQLGDGVFETLRALAGRSVELDEHLDRLHRSAHGLAIPLAASVDAEIRTGIARLLAAEVLDGPDGDASVRITVTRGAHRGRGLLPPDDGIAPTVVIQTWPVSQPPPAWLERGLHLIASSIRRDPSNPLAALKTTSRADFVFARLEAQAAGADDAVFLTLDGRLSEATSANIFLVRNGTLATPSAACAILSGTTRSWIVRWAEASGLRPDETDLTIDDLAAADEAFVSSSVAGILPVTRIADRPIGEGAPGPWSRRARIDREAFVRGTAATEALAG